MTIRAGILGATGAVGQRFVDLLRNHPWIEVSALAASPRSAGQTYRQAVSWRQSRAIPEHIAGMMVKSATPDLDCDFVFSGLGADAAGQIEPEFAAAGIPVISNARAFRMHRDVPLLIPEVNPGHTSLIDRQDWSSGASSAFIVTNPNCSTVGLALTLKPLHDAFGLERVSVTTLQAISGAGYPGPSAVDLLGNVVPYIDGEEQKLAIEPGKILGRYTANGIDPAAFSVSAHCNRVPVVDGHMLCISVGLTALAGPDDVLEVFRDWMSPDDTRGLPSAPDRPIRVLDDPDVPQPIRHRDLDGGMCVSIGRIRPCETHDIKFVALVHNTIRGAAGGAILNAELLLRQGRLGPGPIVVRRLTNRTTPEAEHR